MNPADPAKTAADAYTAGFLDGLRGVPSREGLIEEDRLRVEYRHGWRYGQAAKVQE